MYQEKVLLSVSKDKNSKKYNNKQKKTNKLSSCKKLWNVSLVQYTYECKEKHWIWPSLNRSRKKSNICHYHLIKKIININNKRYLSQVKH